MRKKTIIIGTGLLISVFIIGLWLFYFSPDPRQLSQTKSTQETRAIDFSAQVSESSPEVTDAGLEDQDSTRLLEEDEDETRESAQEIIRDNLINEMADMIFENYLPAGTAEDSSRFLLTFRRVNMNFATDLSGFRVDDSNPPQARQEILDALLHPVIINSAARYYGPRLIERIVHLARNREKSVSTPDGTENRLLTNAETSDLLRHFSRRISYLAHVFEKSAADDQVLNMVEEYLRTVDELRDVYFEYWQLEDDSEADEKERLGREIKTLIRQREEIRKDILSAAATPEMRQAGHDYVYEAQWVYRRVEIDGFSKDAIQALANVGRMLSFMAQDKAEELKESS
ncbi:MAG: hypothetical protein ACLFPY_09365 [Desulfonatronovibrio sp.]